MRKDHGHYYKFGVPAQLVGVAGEECGDFMQL